MKILTIQGSPRKKGNTATVLDMFERRLANRQTVERVDIVDFDIKGCIGCGACQQVADEPGCVQKDDAPGLFERVMAADAVVLATPLYCWGFSAQLKPFIDRHLCMVKGYGMEQYKSLLEAKPLALLVTCGGPVEDNADVIQTTFDRMADFLRCRVVGKYVVPFCTDPDQLGDDAADAAGRMATDIMASLS
jgi:multimeric flavodoxin WrbA